MTTIQIPLDRNPDVAALVDGKEPGDRVYGCFSVKSMDAQTLELRIEEMTDNPEELPKPEEYEDEDDESEESKEEQADEEKAGTEKSPEGKESEAEPYTGKRSGSMGRELAAKMMSGSSSF